MGAALTVGDTLSEQNVGVRQEPHSPSITTTEEVIKGVIKRLLQKRWFTLLLGQYLTNNVYYTLGELVINLSHKATYLCLFVIISQLYRCLILTQILLSFIIYHIFNFY